MNPDQEPWEVARELTRKRYMTLNAIRNQGGEARTPEITSSSDELYNQIVNDHLKRMINADLVEKIDEGERSEGEALPKEGYKYRVTDRRKRYSRSPKRTTVLLRSKREKCGAGSMNSRLAWRYSRRKMSSCEVSSTTRMRTTTH
jgi:hypothetical protein